MILLQGATGLNTGDVLATAIILGMLVMLVGIVAFIILKMMRNRGNTSVTVEQERTVQLQKQVEDLNERVLKIEKLLREVD